MQEDAKGKVCHRPFLLHPRFQQERAATLHPPKWCPSLRLYQVPTNARGSEKPTACTPYSTVFYQPIVVYDTPRVYHPGDENM